MRHYCTGPEFRSLDDIAFSGGAKTAATRMQAALADALEVPAINERLFTSPHPPHLIHPGWPVAPDRISSIPALGCTATISDCSITRNAIPIHYVLRCLPALQESHALYGVGNYLPAALMWRASSTCASRTRSTIFRAGLDFVAGAQQDRSRYPSYTDSAPRSARLHKHARHRRVPAPSGSGRCSAVTGSGAWLLSLITSAISSLAARGSEFGSIRRFQRRRQHHPIDVLKAWRSLKSRSSTMSQSSTACRWAGRKNRNEQVAAGATLAAPGAPVAEETAPGLHLFGPRKRWHSESRSRVVGAAIPAVHVGEGFGLCGARGDLLNRLLAFR